MKDVQKYFTSPEKFIELVDFLNNFPHYSMKNRLLINSQRPAVVAVASFKKIEDLGYAVKRGIKVLVPFESKTFMRNKSKVPVKYATAAEKSKIKKGQIFVYKELRFVHGNVFDVTQTNMPKEKYPEMYPNRHLDFDINNPIDKTKLDQQLDKFAQKLGYSVNRTLPEADYSNTFGIAKGGYRAVKKGNIPQS
ncbi:hypothetical protein F5ESL0233_04320 [Lactobacillus sp. ESL0233]|uniref:hypothetical protein n=2 Tax=Lactobacillus TaxID=1578 RepID=UPI000EFAEC78|nr:hypothetical protein [Lactobacillus sp. ESL0233]RMC41556.1 hypothetical protein F5ESL0233_04320 [Lactobacillus sp. ESL0233]